MDNKRIENGVREILIGIGEDVERPGLIDTPSRVSKMINEVLAYTGKSNSEIAEEFGKCFNEDTSYDEIVIVRDIPCFSWCEHHMALMYDMRISVAYKPCGKVIGLSKISRIADAVTRRLQLQERIGHDIAEIISMVTDSKDVCVLIDAKHSCVTARGIRRDANTRTISKIGCIEESVF